MSESRGRILNRVELADFTGKSLPTIDAWVRTGCPFVDRGGRGREWSFNSADVLDWRERRAAAAVESKAAPGDLDPAQERARKDRALAVQTEMKNDETRGRLIEADKVVSQVAREYGVIRQRFMGIRGKLSDILDPLQGMRVEDEIVAALAELSTPEKFDALREAYDRQAKQGDCR